MDKKRLIHAMASAMYEDICSRAEKMVEDRLPSLNEDQRLLLETGITAGVTAAILALKEVGLFDDA